MNTTNTTYTTNRGPSFGISWPAVFAGLLIGLAVQIVLNLLGVAIGASTIDASPENASAQGMGIGAAAWVAMSVLIGTYVGARTAASLSGAFRKGAAFHGLLTWACSTVLAALLLATGLGTIAGGAMTGIAQYASKDSAVGGTADTFTTQTGSSSQESVQKSEQKAVVADTAAKATASSAWFGFGLLTLCALVAAWAGSSARRDEHVTQATPA